jgi:Family of unknown function (DUF6153)
VQLRVVQRQPRAAVRGLVVLFLLAGVLGMHSLVGMGMPAATPSAGAMVMTDAQPTAPPVNVDAMHSHGGGHGQHATTHECLAVLAAAVLAVTLMLLALGTDVTPSTRRRLRAARTSLGGAPPWTTPTLTGLSVLRV